MTADEHIAIQDDHKPALARFQHVLEWLAADKVRLETELAHVLSQGQRVERELSAVLAQHYGIAPGQPYALDTEAGRIHTVHQEPTPEPPTESSE